MRRAFVVFLCVLSLLGAAVYAQQAAAPVTSAPPQTIIQQVRAQLNKNDFAGAEKLLTDYRAQKGMTPEWLEAYSWMGRGYLGAKKLDEAERYAQATYRMATDMLKSRPMDQEPRLPIAYGAAVEVLAQASGQRGARTEAIVMLERELKAHGKTSIAKRLQKNVNLLSLEGTQAPAIVSNEFLGTRPPTMESLKGKPVLMFFWAHWCPDCKRMAPVLAELDKQYRDKGLVIVAPTQRYGYVAGGKEAPPADEKTYIDQVRKESYPVLASQPVPLDEANHLQYGVSTTPTLVLVDRGGVIRLYHPGQMTLEQLQPLVSKLVG